jgi:putative peptidoglycan lipid II flippase
MSRAIGRATAVIIILGLLDKILAVGKEMLMAARFGAGSQVDAFNIAYAFPGIVNLLFNSACIAAFIPLYGTWQGNPGSSDGLLRDKTLTVIYSSCLFFALLACVCYPLAPAILSILGYGFSLETLALSVHMERMLVWLILLEGLGVTFAALLQSWKRFAALTLTQAFINAAIIVFLVAGHGIGINAVIYGFLAGTALKVVAMMVCSRGLELKPFAPFRVNIPALTEYALLGAPLLGSALIANSNILIDQSMSSSLPEGGVAVLRYAYRVNDLPLQIIVLALSRAIFPFISEQVARNDLPGLRQVFRQSLVFIFLISIPISCYVLIFADEIVDLLLRRGAFDQAAANITALTLRCYSLGLFFHAYTFINGAFFSAYRQGIVLLRLGFLSLSLNFGFNWLFLRLFEGPHAIALSTTVTMGIISIIFLRMLTVRLGREATSGLGGVFTLIAGASALSAGACYPLRGLAAGNGVPLWLSLGIESLLFVAVYLFVIVRFRTGEIHTAVEHCREWATRRWRAP